MMPLIRHLEGEKRTMSVFAIKVHDNPTMTSKYGYVNSTHDGPVRMLIRGSVYDLVCVFLWLSTTSWLTRRLD